ncbi:hypothetical protein C8R45DRAFT_1104236 [Mycena sanguinolenta]|nr:hypothetical protein C8R45DRAFT_1104236 [Mycena sanguinolenta]
MAVGFINPQMVNECPFSDSLYKEDGDREETPQRHVRPFSFGREDPKKREIELGKEFIDSRHTALLSKVDTRREASKQPGRSFHSRTIQARLDSQPRHPSWDWTPSLRLNTDAAVVPKRLSSKTRSELEVARGLSRGGLDPLAHCASSTLRRSSRHTGHPLPLSFGTDAGVGGHSPNSLLSRHIPITLADTLPTGLESHTLEFLDSPVVASHRHPPFPSLPVPWKLCRRIGLDTFSRLAPNLVPRTSESSRRKRNKDDSRRIFPHKQPCADRMHDTPAFIVDSALCARADAPASAEETSSLRPPSVTRHVRLVSFRLGSQAADRSILLGLVPPKDDT